MDSDPLPVLEKSDALQRHQLDGSPQGTGFHFCHPPPGAKRMKSMDGKAQRTTIVVSLRETGTKCSILPASLREAQSKSDGVLAAVDLVAWYLNAGFRLQRSVDCRQLWRRGSAGTGYCGVRHFANCPGEGRATLVLPPPNCPQHRKKGQLCQSPPPRSL